MEQAMVRLDDMVSEIGGSWQAVDYWLQRERVKPAADWTGRPAVPVEQAARVVSAYRAEMESQAQKVAAFDSYLQDRERRRREAGEKAFEEEAERQRERTLQAMRNSADFVSGTLYATPLTGSQLRSCQAAYEEAVQAFDRKHPRPDFESWKP